ncbi:MAG: murein DD-endopeptidase MepM/ murein hydrolase activator NlpD [Oleiphilaceae bacterium]|jgi:murein DD-endopeptidase MepM/ murein hydrolase activator NlpD
MNIIFVGRSHGKSKTLQLGNKHLVLIAVLVTGLLLVIATSGYHLSTVFVESSAVDETLDAETISVWKNELKAQRSDVESLKRSAHEKVDALTLRMGNMQARLLRLDALGQRLTEVAKLKNGEFDFTNPPAVGGPIDDGLGDSYVLPGLAENIERIERQITDVGQQLEVIDSLFVSRNIQKESFIAGRPIKGGWMSSAFGYRTDPFSGKRAWHGGVDFAGKEDSDIIAVASGVVTWSGDRYGYGNLIEINHGGGYTTRYAHCKVLFAKVGDIVAKGQVLAAMGSTGRSTGPHVHYEVRKNGKGIDPKKYIYRASR